MSQYQKFFDGTILSDVETLTGNIGGAVGADAAFNINFLGGNGITVTGVPATNTLTAALPSQVNTLYVGKHGNDANNGTNIDNAKLTIQAAVTAAAPDTTIIVSPGTYTETITHACNNVTIMGCGTSGIAGTASDVIIRQADANVINFSTFIEILYKKIRIEVTAATSAISAVSGTTGGAVFMNCQIVMTSAANLVAAAQPKVGSITSGTINFQNCGLQYYHTGNCGGTAIKAALTVTTGAITVNDFSWITVINSGTALVTCAGYDNGSTGRIGYYQSFSNVSDVNSTYVCGLSYLTGTGKTHTSYYTVIRAAAGAANTGYAYYLSDSALALRTYFDSIRTNDTGGTSYSVRIGNGATWTSNLDDIEAVDGHQLIGGGTLSLCSSESDGNLSVTGLTDHSIVLGSGSDPLTPLGPLTNGQLPIGSTGADPVAATLTAGTGIGITNAAGSITVNSVGGGLTWQTIGASGALAVNNGYICTAGAALSFSLPATSAVGDVVGLTLDGSTSWTVTQAAGQQIRIGNVQTSGGAGGSLASTAAGDTIIMVCSVANTKWNVYSVVGNITVV